MNIINNNKKKKYLRYDFLYNQLIKIGIEFLHN